MRFEFDERKNRQNLAKHGVDFETAQIVFDDPYSLTQPDLIHLDEERWITLGEIAPGVMLFVVHTTFAATDGEEVIRLISARAATSRERKAYEEAHQRAEAPDRGHRGKKGRRH
ncbi:MAG: BrnT family toxin [Acidobacteriota bacterium]